MSDFNATIKGDASDNGSPVAEALPPEADSAVVEVEGHEAESRASVGPSAEADATSVDVEESFDFDEHRRTAVESYQQQRAQYEQYSYVLSSILGAMLAAANIGVHSIEHRAKELESFGRKVKLAAEDDPVQPRYPTPLREITDLAGARVITFFLTDVEAIDRLIDQQFEVVEVINKSAALEREERFGYQSVHYVVKLKPNRCSLPEYKQFDSLMGEIQVRTILQHAWAEIEHDIQYKSVETLPTTIRRRFMQLAGLLEIADREFQAIQQDDKELRAKARLSVSAGDLSGVEITGDALKAYLDRRLGPDLRMGDWNYEWQARMLRRMGFGNVGELERVLTGFDDDGISRAIWGSRQGQISRFEDMLLIAMGPNFLRRFPASDAMRRWREDRLRRAEEKGITIGNRDL